MGIFDREIALYRRLQKEGVQISFLTYGNKADLQYAGRIPEINILCNEWSLPAALYEYLLPLLHGAVLRRADVIKTNQMPGADIALRAARLWRKPLIARCGYIWSEFAAKEKGINSISAYRSQKIENRVFGSAEHIVVTTPEMAANITRRQAVIADKVTVIPNCVDTELFRPDKNVSRDFDIIFVGRISAQKNVEILLEAAGCLNTRVLIIGEGGLARKLQERFNCLKDRIRWEGIVPNDKLPDYLNRAKIFILPSRYEGHPKALLEAMACGLAVIGADSPGIKELIHHGENGWLCKPDAESIQDAIQKLLAQPGLRENLGRSARRYVEEKFSLERAVGTELALLREAGGR